MAVDLSPHLIQQDDDYTPYSRPAPKNTEKIKAQKKRIVKYLRNNNFTVTSVCQHFKISRATFYLWARHDIFFNLEIEAAREANLDRAEGYLYELIEKKFFPAIKFYLEAQGKHRGWGQDMKAMDHGIKNGGDVEAELRKLPPAALLEIEQIIKKNQKTTAALSHESKLENDVIDADFEDVKSEND